MKVDKAYFDSAIIALGHKTYVGSDTYSIEQTEVGLLINKKILIPYARCKEILVSDENAAGQVSLNKPKKVTTEKLFVG